MAIIGRAAAEVCYNELLNFRSNSKSVTNRNRVFFSVRRTAAIIVLHLGNSVVFCPAPMRRSTKTAAAAAAVLTAVSQASRRSRSMLFCVLLLCARKKMLVDDDEGGKEEV